MGLFEYAARKEHQKDVLKLLAECLDVQKSMNFEKFEKVLAKILP